MNDGRSSGTLTAERASMLPQRDLAVSHRHAADTGPEAGALAPEAASHQVVVGDIPAEPPGFRPRVGCSRSWTGPVLGYR